MTPPVTPSLDLEAIEARANAATPGPWFWNSYAKVSAAPLVQAEEDWPIDEATEEVADFGRFYVEAMATVAWVPPRMGDTATGRHAADADLIAHAREDIPALVAALRERDARLVALEAALRELVEQVGTRYDDQWATGPVLLPDLDAARALLSTPVGSGEAAK